MVLSGGGLDAICTERLSRRSAEELEGQGSPLALNFEGVE